MNKFGKKSKENIKTVHVDLQDVCYWLLDYLDIGIIEGVRTIETQQEYVRLGKSKTLNSKHLPQDEDGLAYAVDIGIYVDGKLTWEPKYYYFMYGLIRIYMKEYGGEFRWGGDWDGDLNFSDQTFDDLVHLEKLVKL